MKATSKESFLSVLRHLLTTAGSVAVTHGWMTKSQAVEFLGALVAASGYLWGALDEYFAARRIEDEARIKAAVEAALANYRPTGSVPVTDQTNQPAK
jgi:hypothetical protein